MKNSLFIAAFLGLVLSGCNQATRSSSTESADLGLSSTTSTTSTSPATDTTYGTASTSPSLSPASSPTSTGTLDSASPSSATSPESTGSTYGSTSSSSSTRVDPSTSSNTNDVATDPAASNRPDAMSPASTNRSSQGSLGASSPSLSPSRVPAAPTEPGQSLDASGATAPSSNAPAVGMTDRSSSDIAAATAGAASSDLTARISEWKLSASEVQADLDRSVTIVRTKDSAVGAPVGASDDAVISAMIKGKLQADRELTAAPIEVEARNGEVTLRGTADNAGQVGRAIALALDTPGVSKVSSDLKASPAGTP